MFLFDLRGEIDECVSDYVTTEQKIHMFEQIVPVLYSECNVQHWDYWRKF